LRPHPNVVLFLGVVQDPVCIVTEYMSKGSLDHILKSDIPIGQSLMIKIMKDAASGLFHLHNEVNFLILRNN
jgi:serine/threonine protein kinase